MALTSIAALPSGGKALPPIRPEAEYDLLIKRDPIFKG